MVSTSGETVASACVTEEKDGTAPTPAVSVTEVVVEPIRSAPEYVSTRICSAPDTEEGISVSRVTGGVHAVVVATPVAMVPLCVPKT
jgi:hypothetical protein